MRKLTLLAVLSGLAAGGAFAQVPASCDQPHELDRYQLLRRLSLDLRGKVPTLAEYEALDTQSSVPPSTVTGWLATDDFRKVMRSYHEDLFWPNVSNVSLSNTNSVLQQKAGEPALAIVSAGRRKSLRGDPDLQTTTHGATCGDYQQTHFLPGGDFKPDPAFIYTEVQGTVTVRQEGWRLVQPYWDPSGPMVKVCAFDAQETATGTVGGQAVTCADATAFNTAGCGCGPGLVNCFGPGQVSAKAVLASLREQLGRQVDKVSTGGKPYTDLLLDTKADVNGPINQWKKTFSQNYSLSRVYSPPDDAEALSPTLEFSDTDTWQTVDRGPMHAGVTTLPGYLLRFQTNRGRANRFRIDFECQVFTPPSDIEPPGTGGCVADGTNLTNRCTCRYCHQKLEPLAAHWGQFSEAGNTFLAAMPGSGVASAGKFFKKATNCVGSNSAFCNRFYVTATDGDNPGALLAYQYADANHPDITAALAGGPRKHAMEIIANDTFGKCAVKRVFKSFVKRDMRVEGAATDELDLLGSLSTGFKANNYALPWLVEQVVSLPQYRRVR
ncbi:MAG: hypothetical protein IPJ65_00185 [Archangiaceae bacterium]|nr:hypothetical protein [Archangiaceae bacterium]